MNPRVMGGEWVMPEKQGYLIECCDCGLVHRVNFRVLKVRRAGARDHRKGYQRILSRLGSGYRVELQAFRDDEATAKARLKPPPASEVAK